MLHPKSGPTTPMQMLLQIYCNTLDSTVDGPQLNIELNLHADDDADDDANGTEVMTIALMLLRNRQAKKIIKPKKILYLYT